VKDCGNVELPPPQKDHKKMTIVIDCIKNAATKSNEAATHFKESLGSDVAQAQSAEQCAFLTEGVGPHVDDREAAQCTHVMLAPSAAFLDDRTQCVACCFVFGQVSHEVAQR